MTQVEIEECPVCKSSFFKQYITCKDYLVSQKEFTIQSCESCGLRFTNPRPDANTIGHYYKSINYVSHNDEGKGLVNRIYRLARRFTLRQKLDMINFGQPKRGKLLDIGCGTGLFLETTQKDGWMISGVEPDGNARKIAAARLNINVVESIKDLKEERFDIITMWHVLEHVSDLQETVQELKNRLKIGGYLLIAVPNSDSHDAQHFKQYWAAYDVPRHLSHFTPHTINQLISNVGFVLIGTEPMYFDSFYIGMLSTKYRDGRTNWYESIYEGIRSNWHGGRTGNYSSLIYQFTIKDTDVKRG